MGKVSSNYLTKKSNHSLQHTRWFKYDRDWFVCKQAGYTSRSYMNHLVKSGLQPLIKEVQCAMKETGKIPQNHILQSPIYWPQATRIHHVWLYLVLCEYRLNSGDFLSHYSCKTMAVSTVLFASWLTDEKYWMDYSNKTSFLLMQQGQPGALWADVWRQNYCWPQFR